MILKAMGSGPFWLGISAGARPARERSRSIRNRSRRAAGTARAAARSPSARSVEPAGGAAGSRKPAMTPRHSARVPRMRASGASSPSVARRVPAGPPTTRTTASRCAAAHAELDAVGGRRRAARKDRRGAAQPVGLGVVARAQAVAQQEAHAPARDLGEGGPEGAAVLGQLVDGDRGRGRELALRDHAARLELAQALGEHARADAPEMVPEVAEAHRAVEQLAQDQQVPAVAEDLGSAGDGAELGVPEGLVGHGGGSLPRLVVISNR